MRGSDGGGRSECEGRVWGEIDEGLGGERWRGRGESEGGVIEGGE